MNGFRRFRAFLKRLKSTKFVPEKPANIPVYFERGLGFRKCDAMQTNKLNIHIYNQQMNKNTWEIKALYVLILLFLKNLMQI